MEPSTHIALRKIPWNKGKPVGQKAPLKLKDIWAIRVRLIRRGHHPAKCGRSVTQKSRR